MNRALATFTIAALGAACARAPLGGPKPISHVMPVATTIVHAAGPIDEESWCRACDEAAATLDRELDAILSRKGVTPEEAQAFLDRLTPDGAFDESAHAAAAHGYSRDDVRSFAQRDLVGFGRCSGRIHGSLAALRAKAAPLVAIAEPSRIAWQPDVAVGRAQAKSQKKPAVVVFCAEWSQACAELDRTTFRDREVRALLARDVIAVRPGMTDEDEPRTRKVAAAYAVSAFPTILVLRADGVELRRFDAFTDSKALARAIRDAKTPR